MGLLVCDFRCVSTPEKTSSLWAGFQHNNVYCLYKYTFFETWLLCVALAILELTEQIRLALSSQSSNSLRLLHARIKGIHHHTNQGSFQAASI